MSKPDLDLRSQLAPAYDEAEIADAWRGIQAARNKPKRRWLAFAVPAFAVAAAAAIALVVMRPSSSSEIGALKSLEPVSIAPGAELAATEPARSKSVALDDGSQLQIAPAGKVQVLANDSKQFTMFLERGAIDVAMKAGGPRRWEIETAFATVEPQPADATGPVVGAVFRVASYEHSVTVAVERGVVMVRGERVKGRVQRLTAGQQIVVENSIVASVPTTSPTTSTPTTSTPMTPTASTSTSPSPPPPAAPTQTTTAPTSSPATAPTSPSRPPPPDKPAPSAPSIATAIHDADTLRPTDPAGAAKLLEDSLAASPSDPSAGLARFALGRLYLESLGTPAKAVPLFRTIIAKGSPHSLLEDAHARLVEALIKSGDAAAAKAAFGEYERLYPQGRRLPALRAML